MSLLIKTGVILAILLVSIRLSMLFLLSPVFNLAKVPAKVMVLFVVAIATVLVMGLAIEVEASVNLAAVLSAVAIEVLVGGLMAFGVFAAFAVFSFGGRVLDFQMGFGVASLIDPASGNQSPLLGTVLSMMAVMTFLMLDGHHMIFKGLAFSFEKIPPMSMAIGVDVAPLVSMFGSVFVYGLAVVAPAILVLLLLDVGMAVAARTMPQMNMFIVGIPMKIMIGISVLAISLKYMSPLMGKVYFSIFEYWEKIIN